MLTNVYKIISFVLVFLLIQISLFAGTIREVSYQSQTINSSRKMYVYLPDGYNGSTTFPVFYLLHGGSERYYTWVNNGNAKTILDNAISSGKAKPMIVVMPDVTDFAPDLFTRELMYDIIPYTEANFKTIPDKDHRALAGLSWGGLQTLDAGLYNYDKFGYLGVFSSGWFTSDTQKYATMKTYLNSNGAKIQQNIHYFYFSDGGQWDISYQNGLATIKLLRDNGIKVNYFQNQGGHTYASWSPDLQRFIPFLFQDGSCTPTSIVSNIQINGGSWHASNTAKVCTGNTIKFGPHPYDVTSGWSWKGPDNFTSTQREVEFLNVNASKSGDYIVTFKNAAGCTSTAKVTLIVNSTPSISILTPADNETVSSNSVTVTTAVNGSGIKKVLFLNGNYLIGQDSLPPYSLDWSGLATANYALSVRVINVNNCSDTAKATFSVSNITNLNDELLSDYSITLFPNPFTSVCVINHPETFTYSIYNMTGSEVEKGMGRGQVSLGQQLAKGTYLVKLKDNKGSKSFRIIKK